MTRQIKFRAWDKEKKEWFEPTYEAYAGKLHDISITLDGQIMTRTLNTCADMIDGQNGRYELMQFTGLHDKNGKEIYEHDIVKAGSNVYAVNWEQTGASFRLKNTPEDSESMMNYDDMEIIGNIYENPELIK